jgi:hypothetical protein
MVIIAALYHGPIFSVVHKPLLLAVTLFGLPAPSRVERSEQQTLGGAQLRAEHRVRWFRRGGEMREQNVGARARVNATSDAADEAELPRTLVPGYSPFSRW